MLKSELLEKLKDIAEDADINETILNMEDFAKSSKVDVKTCTDCQQYDGKIYDSNNAPHQHVMCRCELIPIVEDWKPSEKWDNENKQRISYKIYKEWLGKQDLNN